MRNRGTGNVQSWGINQMEREMFSYLDWELTSDRPVLCSSEPAWCADCKHGNKIDTSYTVIAASKVSPSPLPLLLDKHYSEL